MFSLQNIPLLPKKASVKNAMNTAHAAGRVSFTSAGLATIWAAAFPMTEVTTNWWVTSQSGARALHTRVLARPGMNRKLLQAEAEDLLTLPVIASTLGSDVIRIRRKLRSGEAQLPVVPKDDFEYPSYYLNDFHNQRNGGLSLRSALTYEWQIRFLFMGTNRLMRQGVVDAIPVGDHLDILDVATGPATWIRMARQQGRRHRFTGVDVSPQYLRAAKLLNTHAEFHQMKAEALAPEWTDRFDISTCIWLFHEMPVEAMEQAVAEMARVLKPGGTLLFMDSVQPQDVPETSSEPTNEAFHKYFNEPYFLEYSRVDLPAMFARHGLTLEKRDRWHVSVLLTFRKAGAVNSSTT